MKDKYQLLERDQGWQSHLKFTSFLTFMSQSIYLAATWELIAYMEGYNGKGMFFLALALVMFTVGYVVGYLLYHRIYMGSSMKVSMISSMAFGLVGSGIFLAGFYFHHTADVEVGLDLLIIGRFLSGIWLGGYYISEQAYIAETLEKQANQTLLRDISQAELAGFAVGPILGLLGQSFEVSIGDFVINQYTWTALLQTITVVILIIKTSYHFEEIPKKYRRANVEKRAQAEANTEDGNQYLQRLLLSNQSDIFYRPAILNSMNQSNSASHIDITRFLDRRNLSSITNLSAEEIKLLYSTPPNSKGVTLLLAAMFLINLVGGATDYLVTPLLIDYQNTFTNTISG